MSISPGDGYRLLIAGEIIRVGDEYFDEDSGSWQDDSEDAGAKVCLDWLPRRRKVQAVAVVASPHQGLVDRMAKAISDLPLKSISFATVLCEAMELHASKSKDYGSDTDPYANIRASEEFGVAAWHGSLLRSNDKITRLKQFAKKGVLANESAADSMLDLVVYFAITLMLYREVSK